MREMFRGCYALEALDTSSFQTGKVKDMAFMFADCLSLTSLNVDSFDVRNAEDLSYMFYDSRELKKLNLSGFDMGGITSVYGAESLVEGCRELEELWTPRNIKVETSLYGTWYDDKDNAYTEFPRNTGTSIHLRKPKAVEEPDEEESSSSEESSSTEESSSQEESSSSEESSTTEESSSIEESSSQEESSSSEESSTTEESSSTVESSTTEESSSVEESSETEESSDTEESSSQEESSSSEESSTSEESSKADESASSEESSDTEEHPSSEETSSSEESPTEEERSETDESESAEESPTLDESSSPYADEERIDLQKAGGKIAAIKSKTYDGLAYNPSVKVTVTEGGSRRTLTEGTDYSVLYEQNTDAGQGIAVVRGNGLYKGTLRTTFEITPKSIKRLKIMTGSMTAGSQSEPPVYVYDGTKRLEKGKDYTLTYAGDLTAKASKAAKVTVTAAGNYEGSSTVKLAVYENDASHIINPEHVALQTQSVPYTGKAQKPALTVAIDGMTLRANKDYKVQYQNNKNAGTACVVVTGKGAYKGKVVKTFEITALGKTNTSLTVSKISDKTYNGKYQKPSVTVKCGSKKLAKNKDYTVTYQHNLHASADNQKAKVIITGKGNYEGIIETAEFVIKPQKISKAAVKGTMEHFTLTYGGTKLKEGVHYTITSTAKAGSKKVKIKIEGLGDFAGSEMTKRVKAK
jgi:surface protein